MVPIIEAGSHDGTRSIPTYESRVFRKDQKREYMRAKLSRKLGDSIRRDLTLGVLTLPRRVLERRLVVNVLESIIAFRELDLNVHFDETKVCYGTSSALHFVSCDIGLETVGVYNASCKIDVTARVDEFEVRTVRLDCLDLFCDVDQ